MRLYGDTLTRAWLHEGFICHYTSKCRDGSTPVTNNSKICLNFRSTLWLSNLGQHTASKVYLIPSPNNEWDLTPTAAAPRYWMSSDANNELAIFHLVS